MNEGDNEDVSWLCNPFGDSRVYGVKYLIDDENFSWEFFLRAEFKKEAINDGFYGEKGLKETLENVMKE